MVNKDIIKEILKTSSGRDDFWIKFINAHKIKNVCEVGVSEGAFAKVLLQNCPSIQKYYLVDPWKHLNDWNKPANRSNQKFNEAYKKTLTNTNFAKDKRVILKGKTTEVLHKIPDNSLDLVYIDGDHTLRGITIDLIKSYPKVKHNGFIAGDDLHSNIWVHPTRFEPTLVFPFVIHFSEALGVNIYLLPFNQFLIKKGKKQMFKVVDFTSSYANTSLRHQFSIKRIPFKANIKHFIGRIYRKLS